ncbi:MAG: hypothetical protein IJ467_06955 [Bacteroidaceae bacterium]|nr:hypothetical protein [Bacteroidaceae bacterium]
MVEKETSDITFNIYGGTVQILPNATKAEQNFYTGSPTGALPSVEKPEETLSETALRLGLYINKVEDLRGYLTMFAACTTAKEMAEVVAIMAEKEPRLTREEINKARFINLLPSLAPQVTKGITTDNLRTHIDNVMQMRKKKQARKSILG